MKTLVDFKRDAKAGKIKLEMVERYGETGEAIPARCRGIRSIKSVNSVCMTLETADGLTSRLDIPSAKLMEYDGKTLTIYAKGERGLTEQEKNILADWQKVEAKYQKENPYGNTYWKKKNYFQNCPCPWMAGYEEVSGKKYNFYDGTVIDSQIKGQAILKYKVHEVVKEKQDQADQKTNEAAPCYPPKSHKETFYVLRNPEYEDWIKSINEPGTWYPDYSVKDLEKAKSSPYIKNGGYIEVWEHSVAEDGFPLSDPQKVGELHGEELRTAGGGIQTVEDLEQYAKNNPDSLLNPVYGQEEDIVTFAGASICPRYPGIDAFITHDDHVYIGKPENYDNHGHYNNADHSLIHVANSLKAWNVIRGSEPIPQMGEAVKLLNYTPADTEKITRITKLMAEEKVQPADDLLVAGKSVREQEQNQPKKKKNRDMER